MLFDYVYAVSWYITAENEHELETELKNNAMVFCNMYITSVIVDLCYFINFTVLSVVFS